MADSYSPRNSSGRKRSHDDLNDDPSGKKMKNREAARKCREKKVKETEELKKKNEALVKSNEELSLKRRELEIKFEECVKEIIKHRNSGCVLPQNVENIINSSELASVGTISRETMPSSSPVMLNTADNTCPGRMPVEATQPMFTGLFTGKQFSPSAPVPTKQRTRNPSSRSPSRSPPALPVFSNRKQMASQPQPSAFATKNVQSASSNSNLVLKPTWHQLHQQTSNEQMSPGLSLSPAQTVPNIDTNWSSSPDAYHKQNGFPDVTQAVQHAQKDEGVVDDDCDYSPPHYPHSSPHGPSSTGFITNFQTSSQNIVASPGIHGNSDIQNSHQTTSDFPKNLKPTSSSSMAVSMNDTATLLSRAMYNFDDSEISDDLKKQYAELAKRQENKSSQEEPGMNQGYDCDVVQYQVEENTSIVEQYQSNTVTQPQTPVESNNHITHDDLLNLAKEKQSITIEYKGKEYSCTYEQVKQLVNCMKSQTSEAQDNDNAAINQTNQTESYFASIMPTDFLLQSNDIPAYLCSDPLFTPQAQTDLPPVCVATDVLGIVPVVSSQAPGVVEAPVQATHLPTTVLSMMEEESQTSQAPHNPASQEVFTDNAYMASEDYAANVSELPSLSLTEDDTNIFEKKRRVT